MNDVECRRAAELLPERARGALGRESAAWLDAHLASCPECRRELLLVRTLARAAARPPAGLAGRIRSALREERLAGVGPSRSARGARADGSSRASAFGAGLAAGAGVGAAATGRSGRSRPWRRWGIAAAATVVLAIGTARMLERESPVRPSEAELWQAYLEEAPAPWTQDDGLVAGAPVLADLSTLSDEELAVVLEELGP